MFLHHLQPLLLRARIPFMSAFKRTNEQIIRLPGDDVRAIFGVIRTFLLDIHRAFRHREKRLRRFKVLDHRRTVQQTRHFLNRFEIVADAPNHEVGVRAPTHCRIGIDEQVAAEVVDGIDEALLAMRLLGIVEHAPLRSGAIENEVDELTWKFPLVLFQFINVRRQPQRAARCVGWRLGFGAHRWVRRGR